MNANGDINKNKDIKIKKEYSHKRKKKLADKISKIRKKKDYVKILQIIKEDKKDITENNNGLFMYFHDLNDETYYKLENYLHNLNKKRNYYPDSTSEGQTSSISQKEYNPYVTDEFPSQKGISPKLKYSNKEKNLIKRKRYDKNINSENNVDDTILYCYYDTNLTDSEANKQITVDSTTSNDNVSNDNIDNDNIDNVPNNVTDDSMINDSVANDSVANDSVANDSVANDSVANDSNNENDKDNSDNSDNIDNIDNKIKTNKNMKRKSTKKATKTLKNNSKNKTKTT